jgi:hypothetical protein
MNCVAIRFPVLIRPEWAGHLKWRRSNWTQKQFDIDECYSYLAMNDAARLIKAILDADLKGFRRYLPAANKPYINASLIDIIKKCYAGIPLKKTAEQLDSLVDISQITADTGWVPFDNPFAEIADD